VRSRWPGCAQPQPAIRDPGLRSLLAELRAGSEEFTAIWDTNPVRVPVHWTKAMVHPQTGPLRVNCDILSVPEEDHQVVFLTADPGSPSARALRHLADLASRTGPVLRA